MGAAMLDLRGGSWGSGNRSQWISVVASVSHLNRSHFKGSPF